jgi:hypothetical protein
MTLSADEVLALCVKGKRKLPAVHVNVRMTGEDATIFSKLQEVTPELSDSQRIRDSVRVSTFLLLKQDPVLSQLGVFKGE